MTFLALFLSRRNGGNIYVSTWPMIRQLFPRLAVSWQQYLRSEAAVDKIRVAPSWGNDERLDLGENAANL